jgi:hypothetical protein
VVSLDTMLRLFITLSIPLAIDLLFVVGDSQRERWQQNERLSKARHELPRARCKCCARAARPSVVQYWISTAISSLSGCGCAGTALPVRPQAREAQAGWSTRSCHADELQWLSSEESDGAEEEQEAAAVLDGGCLD